MMKRKLIAAYSILLTTMVQQSPAQTPLTSEFTYQGQLTASGLTAITTADFQFALFDAVTDGAQIGTTVSKDNVAIVNGVFTTTLDFGPAAFSGNARWLQVAVRSPSGIGGFTSLAPRQSVTATPNATFSSNTRGISVVDGGNVGLGITPLTSSQHKLTVAGHIAVTQGHGFFALDATNTDFVSGILPSPSGDTEILTGSFGRMHLDSNGRVGIKVFEPAGTLHVATGGFLGGDHEPLLVLEGGRTASVQLFPRSIEEPQTSGEIGFTNPNDPTLL